MPAVDDQAALEARLLAARASREAADARRSARDERVRLLAEVEAEERAVRDAEVLEALEAEHGPLDKMIRRIDTDEGMVVVKRPNHILYKRFVDRGKTTSEALEQLVRPCVIHPADKGELARIFEAMPASLMRAADAVVHLAGARKEDIAGK